jgi:opacity protein-like surface antigen
MFRRRLAGLALALVAVILVACAGYTEQGSKTSEHQGTNGGDLTVEIGKANGTSTKSIELEGTADQTLDADVTLAVGLGSYKIELLGANDEVTLVLEATAGQTVEGQGQMVTDSFGEASFRVTATNAEKVTYVIEYTFR